MSENQDSLLDRWHSLLSHIEKLRKQSLAAAKDVTVIAVSKSHPAERILPLLEAGHKDYGENRVQEAQGKWPALKSRFRQVRLHLIGSLQTNKAKDALALFDVIHTVDRESLVDALVKATDESSDARCRQFFIQVNTAQEPQKGGVAPGQAGALLDYCRAHGLPVTGLMCIPPAGESPAPHFALLRKLAQEFGLPELSMGMSGDYDVAIRLGATHVRVGTAIFGERPQG